jgi:hypothetical protein
MLASRNWRVLQNRRVQVRFLSHLPKKPEFMKVAAVWLAESVYVDPYLTPMPYHQEQHRRSMTAAQVVMELLVHATPVTFAQSYSVASYRCGTRTLDFAEVMPFPTMPLWFVTPQSDEPATTVETPLAQHCDATAHDVMNGYA